MLPWEIVERARAPDGTELVLARRGEEWVVRAGGRVLMSSRVHGSEEALAAFALEAAPRARTILVGGLGLGYTVRAALDRLPDDARAVVVELVPALVGWCRGPLADLAGRPLDDPRVRLQQGDVLGRIREAKGAYDAILLDVDNGPAPVSRPANARLYGEEGIRACRDALRAGGVLAVWSAGPDERYLERLERAGLLGARMRQVPARGAGAGGERHAIFLAVRDPREARAPRPRPAATPLPAKGGGARPVARPARAGPAKGGGPRPERRPAAAAAGKGGGTRLVRRPAGRPPGGR